VKTQKKKLTPMEKMKLKMKRQLEGFQKEDQKKAKLTKDRKRETTDANREIAQHFLGEWVCLAVVAGVRQHACACACACARVCVRARSSMRAFVFVRTFAMCGFPRRHINASFRYL
jgi:hypothetical protein